MFVNLYAAISIERKNTVRLGIGPFHAWRTNRHTWHSKTGHIWPLCQQARDDLCWDVALDDIVFDHSSMARMKALRHTMLVLDRDELSV